MRICFLADTHGLHDRVCVPEADLLIHAGDISMSGRRGEIESFLGWWRRLPHPHKVFIAGNHDWLFQKEPAAARAFLGDCVYLEDSLAEVKGLRIWGSPWQPWFLDWAFNLQRGEEIRGKWDLIPEGIDILVTHGPPFGHGDRVERGSNEGCADLLDAVLNRVRPRWHFFGHIHEGYGTTKEGGTTFINASVVDARYSLANRPVVVETVGGES